MTQIAEWLPLVRVEALNCPGPLILDAIRQALIDFCQESQYWRYPVCLEAVPNINQYSLDPPAGTTTVSVRVLRFDYRGEVTGSQVEADDTTFYPLGVHDAMKEVNVDDLDRWEPQWRMRPGTPMKFAYLNPDTIILNRVPQTRAIMQGTITLRPTQDALQVDDILWERWRHAIANGALARLMAMNNKPWTDQQTGQVKYGLYETARNEARKQALVGLGKRTFPHSRGNYF